MTRRHRSPNYPAVGLREAGELIDKLWQKERASKVPVATAVRHMGYQGYSGPTRTKVSALCKFGLLDQFGEDVQITELGERIVAPVSSGEREAAMREAASRVELFAELQEEFPDASDETLRSVLERRGFTGNGAVQALSAYRDTLAVLGSVASKPSPSDTPTVDAGQTTSVADDAVHRGISTLKFQVSERIVAVSVEGDTLTAGELDALVVLLRAQQQVVERMDRSNVGDQSASSTERLLHETASVASHEQAPAAWHSDHGSAGA